MRSSAIIFALIVAPLAARADDSPQPNPVVATDAPDPGVVRVGDTYYMVTTSGNDPNGFPIRTSKDLAHWTDAGFVFPAGSRPAWAVSDFWAPEIHRVGSQYVCYFTARDASGRLCVGAATAPSPTGPFTASEQPLVRDPSVGSIDPTFFEDTDGTRYLYWKSDGNDVGEPSRIHVQKLAPDGLSLTGESTAVLTNDQPWETTCVEGPAVVKKDGYYYLFYSGNMFNDPGYSVGVARSTSPTGPFEKHPGGPILHQGPNFVGPGHNSIVTDPEGATFIVYHAYSAGDMGGPRKTLVDRVRWENGWPAVNDGTAGTTFVPPAMDPGLAPPRPPASTPSTATRPPERHRPSFFEQLARWLDDAIRSLARESRGFTKRLGAASAR